MSYPPPATEIPCQHLLEVLVLLICLKSIHKYWIFRETYWIFLSILYFRRRKVKEESSTNKGLEFNGPYGYTNDVISPTSPDRPTPRLPQTLGKQESPQNDDIYHSIKENEQEYAYADVESNTISDNTKKHDSKNLIVVYAQSEYGGRAYNEKGHYPTDSTDYAYACSSKITDQSIDDDYVYATSDFVTTPQLVNETEANNDNEGWENNEIYAKENKNNVEVKENQEGWEDNSIYADSDKGPEVKSQDNEDEGWEDNLVYTSNGK